MRRFFKWFLRTLALLIMLIVLGALVLPWKQWLETKIIAAIAAKGITPVILTIDHVGLNGIVLKDVALGNPPLKLANATISYAPRALMRQEIESVVLHGLMLDVAQTDEGWDIVGLSGLSKPAEEGATNSIPTTRAALSPVPLPTIAIDESTISIAAPTWNANLPVHVMLQTKPVLSANLASAGLNAHAGENAVTSGAMNIDVALDETKETWNGKWSIADIAITSEALTVPTLKASGELSATKNHATVSGTLADAKRIYRAKFAVDYDLGKPETSRLTIEEAIIPWGGGTVALNKVKLPLASNKPITFNLAVNKVELASLMKALTGDSATATGVVTGAIPVTYTPGTGQITIGQGALKAEEPGIIALSPDAIPGDNPQVGLVRDVLKNLHYSLLSLELGMDDHHMLIARLAVEGKNPDVENGRPIKLQVNLSGDLLNLLLQNMKLMTDPTQFIEKSTHEKVSN